MKKLNIALIGAGFMGKAHSWAYAGMPMLFWPTPAIPYRKTIVDITDELAKEASERFGYDNYTSSWEDVIKDPSIDVVDIVTPNKTHAEIAIAAAKAGKHVICEKPLGRTAEEAKKMLDVANDNGIVHAVGFNYRKVPAVALARKYINEGSLGKVLNFRGVYAQDWSADQNVPFDWHHSKEESGTGALGDIGSHVIDLARFLVGEVTEVTSLAKTWIPERIDKLGKKQEVQVDDQVNALLKFENNAVGSLEATRNAFGRKNFLSFEIHCEKGSLYFNYERRDELQVCFTQDPLDRNGWKTIRTGKSHPYGEALWQDGIGVGYVETKMIELYEFFKAIQDSKSVSPSFEDGYKNCLIVDAIQKSSMTKTWVKI